MPGGQSIGPGQFLPAGRPILFLSFGSVTGACRYRSHLPHHPIAIPLENWFTSTPGAGPPAVFFPRAVGHAPRRQGLIKSPCPRGVPKPREGKDAACVPHSIRRFHEITACRSGGRIHPPIRQCHSQMQRMAINRMAIKKAEITDLDF